MTNAPERIKLRNAGCHETEGRQIWTNVGMGYEKVEYIRADIHDALVKAADELAEAAREDLNAWPSTLVEGSSLGIALAAYRKAKER